MSHVDEGLIHAYLDGALRPGSEQGEEIERHLELCVDCRVRLEKARELRERAQLVMHRLAPAVIAKPSFDEILARRGRTTPTTTGAGAASAPADAGSPRKVRRRSAVPAMPLAWAASLVLALGAGWMAREYLWTERLAEHAELTATTSAADADAAAGESARRSGFDAQAGTTAPGVGAEAEGARARPEPTAPAPAASAREAPAAERPIEKAADEVRVEAAPPPAARQQQRLAPIVVDAPERAALARAALSAQASIVPEALVVDLADSAAARGGRARLEEHAELLRDYMAATAAAEWRQVPEYEIPGILGYQTPARIEGLQPTRVEESGAADARLRRSVYPLEDGSTVELLQRLRPAALALEEVVVTGVAPTRDSLRRPPPDSAGALRELQARSPLETAAGRPVRLTTHNDTTAVLEGATLVAVGRPNGVVILIGEQPADVLRALAERIR